MKRDRARDKERKKERERERERETVRERERDREREREKERQREKEIKEGERGSARACNIYRDQICVRHGFEVRNLGIQEGVCYRAV